MKIANVLREFSERYDRTAIESIENLSRDISLTRENKTIKLFNLKESFDRFKEYMEGYSSYKIENINNENASPQEKITEQTKKFIEGLIKESDVMYSELPNFISDYLEGVQSIIKTTDESKREMLESSIDQEEIGIVNEFVDQFIESISESLHPAMNRILWASGYNANQRIFGKRTPINQRPVFV